MKNNIAFYFPFGIYKLGGTERVLSIIANFLTERYNVTIISHIEGETPFTINENVKLKTLKMIDTDNKVYRKIRPLFYLKELKGILLENNINILITIGTTAGLMSLLAKPKHIKLYTWIHHSYFEKLPIIDEIFKNYFLKRFEKIIVLNKTDVIYYQSKLINSKIVRIPNPLTFQTTKKSSLENKVIISAGRLTSIKGYDQLIKSFKLVIEKHPKWELKIFGEDHGEKENLLTLIKNLKLENNVKLMGETSDIFNEYLNSSIYVLSSKYECFPMVLLEAKACGLPIVSYDCDSGPRDIVNNAEDGFLITPGNIHEFANKIIYLIDNKEKRKIFGNNATIDSQKYHKEKIIKQWIDLIDDIKI